MITVIGFKKYAENFNLAKYPKEYRLSLPVGTGYLSSVSGTHIVAGEDQILKVMLWHICATICMHKHIHTCAQTCTHTHKNIKCNFFKESIVRIWKTLKKT